MTKRKDNMIEHKLAYRKGTLPEAIIQEALEPYGVTMTPHLAVMVRVYIRLLLRWSARISLTSLTDTENILRFHFGESLFAAEAVPMESGRLADVGPGAGFPGLAIKLARPDILVTLLESNNKKCVFLEEIVRSLSLQGVTVVRGRFEDFSSEGQCMDFVTSRALGKLNELLTWCPSVLKKGGHLVLWLGEEDAKRTSRSPGFSWRPRVLVPGSKRRFLLVGQLIG